MACAKNHRQRRVKPKNGRTKNGTMRLSVWWPAAALRLFRHTHRNGCRVGLGLRLDFVGYHVIREKRLIKICTLRAPLSPADPAGSSRSDFRSACAPQFFRH